jgi:putative glutamine amidotransferase
MQNRPLIGVPAQTLQAIDDIPAKLPHSWVMNARYLAALAAVGGAPVILPLFDEGAAALRAVYDAVDAVFLAGGVDVDPSSYGEPRASTCGNTDPARDRVEIALARWARAEGKPVLGVCRGLQILNVAAGGSLHQDATAELPYAIKHDYFPTAGHARDHLAHEVRVTPGTRLHAIAQAPSLVVNSMHHQVVKTLAAGLVASGHAPDGLVEAVEAPDEAFTLGVQWHPEMLIEKDGVTRRLFEAFVEAAASYREQRNVTLV